MSVGEKISNLFREIREWQDKSYQNSFLMNYGIFFLIISMVIGWMLCFMGSIRASLLITIFIMGVVGVIIAPYVGILGIIFAFFFLPGTAWYMSGLEGMHPILIFTVVTLVCWLAKIMMVRNSSIVYSRELIILIFMLLMMICSTLNAAYSPKISWNWNMEFLRLILMFFIFVNLLTSFKRLDIIYWIIVLCCGYMALQGCRSYVLEGYSRLENIGEGQFADSNELACMLATIIPFLFYRCFSRKKWEKLLSIFLIFPTGFAVIIASSRAASLQVVLMVLLILLRKKLSPKVLILLGLFLGVILILAPRQYWERQKTLEHYQDEGSAVSRVKLMKAGIAMWKDHPILGVGQGNFRYKCPAYYHGPGTNTRVAHNTYIEILSEGGICTFVIYILLIFSIATKLRWIRKYAPVEVDGFKVREMATILEITLYGFWCVHSVFLNKTYYVAPYFFYAMSVALENIVRSNNMLLKK